MCQKERFYHLEIDLIGEKEKVLNNKIVGDASGQVSSLSVYESA